MTEHRFSRTEMLLGRDAMERLKKARVAVFGVGGVGSYVVEALARSGVGALDLIDNDMVNLTNINRQIIALNSTIGQYKVDVAKARVHDINPDIQVNVYRTFYLPENAHEFHFEEYDYVVDAIDTVTGKLMLVMQAKEAGTPIISSMGTGNKLDPTQFKVADVFETNVCPLAKVMRRELKKRGIDKLKVLYSEEEPLSPIVTKKTGELGDVKTEEGVQKEVRRRATPASIAFVPSVAGLIIAGEVVKDLCKGEI